MHSPIAVRVCGPGQSGKMRPEERQICSAQPVLGGRELVPIRIVESGRAHIVEALALFLREHKVGGGEIVLELCLAPTADDERGDAGPANQPRKRHLGPRHAASSGGFDDNIDDVPELFFIMDRRLVPAGKLTGALRCRLIAAMLARKQATRKRTPHQDAETLVDRDRYELIFGLARLEGVVDLLCDEARQAEALPNGKGLHDVPAGIVRTSDIADFSGTEQHVERREGFLERRETVPFMELVKIDDISLEPLETGLAFIDDMVA